MKKSIIFSGLLAAAALMSIGCNKVTPPPSGYVDPDLVSFSTSGLSMEVSTKATEVTSSNLGTFNVIAASGSAGSQSQVWSTTASKVGATDVWATDKYWPSTDQGYTSFYASNAALTFNAAGPTVSPADNSVDVVVAYNDSPAYREQNSLEFEHIFARVRNIVLNTQSGYELSAVSATLQNPITRGMYNLRTQVWTPGAASANQAMGAFSGSATAQTSTNDYWLVPGDYTLSVSYTLTKGDYQESFTKTGTVTLLQCCNNTITATAVGGSASDIRFGVSVFPWNSNEIIMGWEPNANGHDYVDLGLRAGGNKILFATCNIGAANPQDYGDYFAWGETSKRYTSVDGYTVTGATFELSNAPYHTRNNSDTGWTKYIPTDMPSFWSGGGSPDNLLTLESSDDVAHVLWGGDWRMPTAEELCMLINGDGTSTDYDITDNVTYEWTYNYNSTDVAGFLITGKGEYNVASIFLPAAGCCSDIARWDAGDFGSYWSRSLYAVNPSSVWVLSFDGDQWMDDYPRYGGRSVRPVLVVPE